MVDYNIIGQVETRVDVTQEITGEFTSCLELGVTKEIEKVLDEAAEKSVDKPVTNSWFQLIEKFRFVYLLKVKII